MKKKHELSFPYAISIIRNQLYNPVVAIDNDHIHMLEHMLSLAEIFEQQRQVQFFHNLDQLVEETRLKKYTVIKTIKYWQKLGVLEVEKRGIHNNNYYSINYVKVLNLIPKLYRKFRNYEPNEVKSRAIKDIVRRIKRRKEIRNRCAIER